jgi:hypothetical protein
MHLASAHKQSLARISATTTGLHAISPFSLKQPTHVDQFPFTVMLF